MILSIQNNTVTNIVPMFENKDIAIGVDSSKTNTAIAVHVNGEDRVYIELNGSADGTSEYDTLALCKKERDVLKVLFKGARVRLVGIENIITVANSRKATGITVHTSRFKITAVFMSIISFFQDNFNITPRLVNNQSWKHEILPAEFCKREYEKGSLAYFRSIGSPLASYSDDVTDAHCILSYTMLNSDITWEIPITEKQHTAYKYRLLICSSKTNLKKSTTYLYNNDFDFDGNVGFIVNRTKEKIISEVIVETKNIPLSILYSCVTGTFGKCEPTVKVVIVRGE